MNTKKNMHRWDFLSKFSTNRNALMLVLIGLSCSIVSVSQTPGCTIIDALNFNPSATVDDGTCVTGICYPELETVNFGQYDWDDPSASYSQDRITNDIWIVRDSQGLYNAFSESGYSSNQSPQNTLWKDGSYDPSDDPNALGQMVYGNWDSLFGSSASDLYGATTTLYLPGHDLYFEIYWSDWSSFETAFSYQRTYIPTDGCLSLNAVLGCMDELACNYDSSANSNPLEDQCEYESCGGCTPLNLSLNKPAIQSSGNDPAPRAVDGNRSGVYGHSSVTHTHHEMNPWWQVDLGDIYANINNIRVWNRTDCCSSRLSDFKLFISNHPITSNDPIALENDPNIWTYTHSGYPPVVTSVPVNISGRYIRIQLVHPSQALSLAEVEVYGCGEIILPGCSDSSACNYDPEALFDDGNQCDFSCIGCMDMNACNYNMSATVAVACVFASGCDTCSGETNGTGVVVDNDADDDGVCNAAEVAGCQDNTACNYDAAATDAVECLFASGCDTCSGETDGTGTVVDNDTDDDGVCDADEVIGCTDLNACNYNASATEDDGTLCDYSCVGCTTSSACNYDSSATISDLELCDYSCHGCLDLDACNYDSSATMDPYGGECDYSCVGCTEDEACNYDENATIDDGNQCEFDSCAGCIDPNGCDYDSTATLELSCDYSCVGCGDVAACNYDSEATITDPEYCEYYSCAGCIDEQACNFNFAATIHDSIFCDYSCIGCTDSSACNYAPDATMDNGSQCEYSSCAGCTTSSACNYDSSATISDLELCDYSCHGCLDLDACNYDSSATMDPYGGECDYTSCSGCTDSSACNYDSEATVGNDDLCDYISCASCDDSSACNYDPDAIVGNYDLCEYESCATCGESDACNYDSDYIVSDYNLCDFTSCIGCTDSSACNYDSEATIDNDQCDYLSCASCDDSSACNYDPDYILGNYDLCEYDSCASCDDSSACNYDPDYIVGNYDLCEYESCATCGDSQSCNYDENYIVNDESLCDYESCLVCSDSQSCNYESDYLFYDTSTCDYESCLVCSDSSACNYESDYVFYDTSLCEYESCLVCSDSGACNYDSDYQIYDTSLCEYESCIVCSDGQACNYDSDYVIYDTSTCDYESCASCDDYSACNYDSEYVLGDSDLCDYNSCADCTDPTACNYDASIEVIEGEEQDYYDQGCRYADDNCEFCSEHDSDGTGLVLDSDIDDDGHCDTLGCTYPSACNYDAEAEFDNGTCDYSCHGCMDMEASNYNPEATIDNESCVIGTSCPGDFSGDGYVNVSDLGGFLGAFGDACE